MDEQKRIFAERLNYYMNLRGKDQIDLVTELGVNKSTISTWCRGEKMPRMGTIQTLADYFGINKSDLIEDKRTPTANKHSGRTEEFIQLFNLLSAEQQKIIVQQIKGILSNQ